MVEPANGPQPLIALVYVLDEMRETTNLLRVHEVLQEGHRPWWRNVVFGFIRVGREATADQAMQYLGENIDRARDHWREALRLLAELRTTAADDDFFVLLDRELDAAGVSSVLPRLAHDAIPGPRKEAAAYLVKVVETIRDCTQLISNARNRLTLQRMREQGD
jgi:hypothetical protein